MAWYNTGTIALTNGSATVTGSGTNFLVGAQIGEALYAPDGKLYEIQTINSATVITLASNYLGSTASGQGYQIIPTQSLVADLASDVTDLISDFANVRDYAGNGKFNDGAVGTPGITFTQDQDNGLYRIGSNNWALAAGGIKQVDLSATDVEINYAGVKKLATTATGVDVTGTVTADGLTVDGSSTFDDILLTAVALPSAGNPSIALRNTDNNIYIQAGSGNAITFLDSSQNTMLSATPTSHSLQISNGNAFAIDSNRDISFYEDTGTTPKFFWDASAESLGIGTNLPAYKLDVQGGAISAGNGTIKTGISYDTAGRLGTFSNHVLKLITNNTERMTIDAGGSVLIGKTTPTDLHNTWNHIIIGEKGAIISENGAGGIDGITLADNVYVDSDTGTYAYQTAAAASQITQSGGAITFSNADSGSAGAALTPVPRMTLDASGNLLVGDSSQLSSSKVLVSFNGTSHNGIVLKTTRAATGSSFEVYLNSSNQVAGSIAHSGSTTVSFNTSSDQRLKENIADADDAGSKIDSIQVRKFDWKADGSHQDYGMVAQELLEVAPEAVHQPQDPEEMMGVDYSKLVPMMLKEIQSLRARIAALES